MQFTKFISGTFLFLIVLSGVKQLPKCAEHFVSPVLWVLCILSSLISFLCMTMMFQLAFFSSCLDAMSSTIVVFYILTPTVTFEDETVKVRVNLNSSALRYCKIHNQLQENLRKIPII